MRELYERQLAKLKGYIEEMGQMIVHAIEEAIDALIKGNVQEAKETVSHDDQINHMEREIENLCLNLLLSQQPVATDLRMVSAALKMVTDMERIGDHAADISEITLLLSQAGYPDNRDLTKLQKMAQETISMVKDSIDACLQKNTQKAVAVIQYDDVVDNYFVEIKQDVIKEINGNIQSGEQAADVLMIAKYLERIGDHATNIAEWVLFYITGERPDVTVQ